MKESFASLVPSAGDSIELPQQMMPGAQEVLQRSACIAAEKGHTTIFSFLLDQVVPITVKVAAAAFVGNNTELLQALLEHGWEPRAGHSHHPSVECSS